jgi:hypothetical protein
MNFPRTFLCTSRRLSSLAALALLATTAGCNIFDPFDSPSGDAQLLSAARACFDQGDIACANEYYGQLSTTTLKDTALSEQAFAILDSQGVTMAVFLKVGLGGGMGPRAISALANELAKGSPGSTMREQIFQAFQKANSINEPTVKGFAKFITATSFLAELFAEAAVNAGGARTFEAADYVATPGTCKAISSLATAVGSAACDPVATAFSNSSAIPVELTELPSAPSGTPTVGLLRGAIDQVEQGLSAVGAGGVFASGALDFAKALKALNDLPDVGIPDSQVSQAAMNLLLRLGIGE